jgi:acyl-CoA synthetase (AMP-forming)/AMP-acid ligase II
LSGEVIARAVERRAAERGGGMAIQANRVTTWAELRRLTRRWATRLRDGLDAIPEA